MNIAIRDKTIIALQAEISDRQQMLIDKYSELMETAQENEFLEGIVEDYGAYYAYIVKQKQDQINSLETIFRYLEGVMETMSLTERSLKEAKYEQNEILAELNKIKGELDEVVKKGYKV